MLLVICYPPLMLTPPILPPAPPNSTDYKIIYPRPVCHVRSLLCTESDIRPNPNLNNPNPFLLSGFHCSNQEIAFMGFSSGSKLLLLGVLFAALTLLVASSEPPHAQRHRRLLQDEQESVLPTKNTTKLLNPSSKQSSTTSQAIDSPVKSSSTSSKNKTKLIKPVSGSLKNKAKSIISDLVTTEAEADGLKRIKSNLKSSSSLLSSDSSKSKSPAAYENTGLATKKKKKQKEGNEVDIKDQKKNATNNKNQNQNPQITKSPSQPNWIYNSDDDDPVSEFANLPSKFQRTIIPDIKRISSSSKIYFSKANTEITRGFKPYVGSKYAATAATSISFGFILVPFLLVSLLFNHIKAYFSLQRLLIFVQVYLSIYFSILCFSSLVTGLEPLRFFYATSQSTYVWLQVLQTLGYVFYLLMLLMYLVLVFSTESGPRLKLLGLAQTFLGFAVGLHYYMTVFHRMVLRQPPRTSWKVHAIYATCFLLICLLAGAGDRKKAYLGDGGEDCKKS